MKHQSVVFFMTALLAACASPPQPAVAGLAPGTEVSLTRDEHEALRVFAGDDARAMARLGERLEKDRPPFSSALLDEMLEVLTNSRPGDPGVRMLRPMVFRTVSVIVGPAARPTLERCAAGAGEYATLCSETLREMESPRNPE